MAKLTFELRLRSDYHVGSGHRGTDDSDSALLREADGRPALRGSVLGQMMRQAAIDLLQTAALSRLAYHGCRASGAAAPEYCGAWQAETAPCPICFAFGSPRRPRPWRFGSARIPDHAPTSSANRSWAGAPITRVRVSPRTRRAENGKLFVEELGDSRLTFLFDVEWVAAGQPTVADIAFLAAAARNLRAIGRSRRRGRGACTVNLVEVTGGPALEADVLDAFRTTWVEGTWEPVLPQPSVRSAPAVRHTDPDAGPVRIQLTLHIDEPVLVARRAEAGNQFEGTLSIPGTVTLGAFAARTRARLGTETDGFVDLFRRGRVRFPSLFLCATSPAGSPLYPSFAAPLDMFRCVEHPFSSRASRVRHPDRTFGGTSDGRIQCPDCVQVARSAGKTIEWVGDMEPVEGYLTLQGGDLVAIDPQQREELHIRIDPDTQRVQRGDLFSYVPLEAGQYLYGELVCRDRFTWDRMCDAADLPDEGAPFTLRLGKATGRGYGQVTAVWSVAPGGAAVGLLAPLDQRWPDADAPFTLLLATDTIVADVWGRFPAGFDAAWLSEELGVQVELMPQPTPVAASRGGFSRSRAIDGFNGQLGLPRWRDAALVAGSVVTLRRVGTGDDAALRAALERAEQFGIGLRRAEGFGQIVLNHPLYGMVSAEPTPVPGARAATIEIDRPEALRPVVGVVGTVGAAAEFQQRWTRNLAKFTRDSAAALRVAELVGAARLMRSWKARPLSELIARLELLVDGSASVAWADVGIDAAPAGRKTLSRERKARFAEGSPMARGIAEICKQLRALQKESEAQHGIGILLLADAVAEAAEAARQEKAAR